MKFEHLATATGFLIQWACILLAAAVLAFGFFTFGTSLERAAFFYARGQSQETLQALYTNTKWAVIVEGKNRQLEAICQRLKKKDRKGLCPVES